MTKLAFKYRAMLVMGVALMSWLLPAHFARADRAAASSSTSLKTLSQRVWALQTIHDLSLDTEQLKRLAALAPEAAGRSNDARDVTAPREYVAALEALHAALLKGDDDGRISELRDDVKTLEEDDNINIDDGVTLSDAARAKAAEFVRGLTPGQVAGHISTYEDEVPNPVEMLMEAAGELRGVTGGGANAKIEQTTEDVRILLAGLNVEKSEPAAGKVRDWLDKARALSDVDFKAQRADLEKSAAELCADADAFVVLRHWIERDVAELLSNPQLAAVIEAKLAQTPAK